MGMTIEEKREAVKRDYIKGGMSLKDLAKKYNVKINTIKTWRSRYGWKREKSPFEGNNFAVRNRGGAPKGNMNGAKHGLFAKFIPPETLEAMEAIDDKDPLDILWDQIKIQYAAILRSQSIMFVTSKDELIKVQSRLREGGNMKEIQWEIQFAWDRQATFLNAQSRAISELRSTIRQYVDMTYDTDERKLKLRQMQINIRKVKTEIKKLQNEILNFNPDTEEQTIIVSGEEEMRKIVEEQQNNNDNNNSGEDVS